MPRIVEFTLPPKQFALQETLQQYPDFTFEIDRVVADESGRITPFVWVSGEETSELTSVLEADSSVTDVQLLTESSDGERFYRLEWNDETPVIGYMLLECDVAIQKAIATHESWTIRVLFPNDGDVSKACDFAREQGLSLNLKRIYDVDNTEHARFGLTEGQYDALVESFDHGYYTIPRKVDATELAKDLEISHQALSERLRRATGNLIQNTLVVGDEVQKN